MVVKLLRLELDKEHPHRAAARFEREARVIARLEHPHIVPLYHFDVNEDGRAYLVLRYMRGGSLADVLKRQGALNLAQFERIARQVAEALDYAHAHGVIHRDLKPSNILLDEEDNAYLADFGLARLMEISIEVSHHAPFIGTPTYAAPEQLQDHRVDHRADLYAYAVVLYHALTGRPPFLPSENGMMALIYHHLHDLPPPPSSLNPQLPPAIDALFLQALAKHPGERYPSARRMVSDLCAALNLSPTWHTSPRKRRAPLAVFSVGVIAVVAVLFMLSLRPFAPAPFEAQLLVGEVGATHDALPTDDETANARNRLGGGFIAYLACSQGDGYVREIQEAMERRAGEYRLPLRVYNANLDPILYTAQIQAAWGEGARAFIACYLSSATSALATLQEAYQAGIPIVFLSATTFPNSANIEAVSTDTGRALGETAGTVINRDMAGEARAVILYYGATANALEIRDAMLTGLFQSGAEVEIVATYPVMWENDIPGVIDALRGLDFDIIVTLNQRFGAPLADALATAGYDPGDIAVVSLIADDRTRDYMREGFFLRGGAELNISMMGQVAVDAAVKLLGGGALPQTIRLSAYEFLSTHRAID